MSKLKIKPLADRVLVEPLEAETKTASGIIIPDTAKEKPQKGNVVAVGAGTEGPARPAWLRLPVVVVVAETIHLRLGLAVVGLLGLPSALFLQLLPPDLLPFQFEQLPLQPLVLSLRSDLLLQLLLGVAETGLRIVLLRDRCSGVPLSLAGVLAGQELPDLLQLFQLCPKLIHLLLD